MAVEGRGLVVTKPPEPVGVLAEGAPAWVSVSGTVGVVTAALGLVCDGLTISAADAPGLAGRAGWIAAGASGDAADDAIAVAARLPVASGAAVVAGLAPAATGWDAATCATAGASPGAAACVATVASGLAAAAGADPAGATDGTGCAMAEAVMGAGVEASLVCAEARVTRSLVSPCTGSAIGTDGPTDAVTDAVLGPVRAAAVGAVIGAAAVTVADGGGEVVSPMTTVVGGVGDIGSATPPGAGAPEAATVTVLGDVGNGTMASPDGAFAVAPGVARCNGADRPEAGSRLPTAVTAGGLEAAGPAGPLSGSAATGAWTIGLPSRRARPASTTARPCA
jgi:hypothetical protein